MLFQRHYDKNQVIPILLNNFTFIFEYKRRNSLRDYEPPIS